MNENNDKGKKLKRDMGIFSITMLGIGAMIGAGIFVLVGHAAGASGPGLLLAFFLNALIACIVGACYAELASAVPRAGGAYYWVKRTLGRTAGFFAGWLSWFGHAVACSLYALGFGSFLFALIDMGRRSISFPEESFTKITATLLILILSYVNFRGSGETGKVEIIITGVKIAIIAVFIGFGLKHVLGEPEPLNRFRPFMPEGIIGVFAAMGLTFIAFEGYEIIAQTGEEVKDPGSLLPRAIFLSIAVSAAIYLLVGFVLLGGVEVPEGQAVYRYLGNFGELGLAEAAGQFMPLGKLTLLLGGMASTAGALNATIYSSSRVGFAMGREGDLHRVFGTIGERTGTPVVSVTVTSAIVIYMSWTLPIKDVAAGADIMFILLFMSVCLAVMVMRRKEPDLVRPFTVPFGPLLPSMGIIAGIGLSLGLLDISVKAWITAAVWLALGAVVLFMGSFFRRR